MRTDRVWHVYVVELRVDLCRWEGCWAPNGKAPVYVGQTGLSPRERLANHLAGTKSSKVVRRYGHRLRPSLSRGWGPYSTYEQSRQAEHELFEALKAEGYCVRGGR